MATKTPLRTFYSTAMNPCSGVVGIGRVGAPFRLTTALCMSFIAPCVGFPHPEPDRQPVRLGFDQ